MQPVEPNVPKQIVDGYTELGNYLAKEMRGAGFKGITTDSTYDAWSPSRAYSHYHGGVRILQETASCRLATPITVKFEQLRPGEGYDPRKDAANFGPVWQGGEWHIRDITNTMTTVAFFLLKHAAQNREHWLERFYEIEKEAVRPRKSGELQGFEIIGREGDPVSVRRILNRGGVQVDYGHPQSVALLRVREKLVPISMYVPMAQPYASFAKALLESQHYPDLRDSTGRPIPPYDVTAHSLPLLMGVEVKPIYSALRYQKVLIDEEAELNYSGKESRVAIYKSHVPSMDEGWTRWVLEHNATNSSKTGRSAPFSSLMDAEVRDGKLSAKYDTIIIPDQPRSEQRRDAILNGYRAGTMPPEYTGGLGAEGVKALREFVEQGGTLVCLNRASDFAIEQFKLPVRDVVDGLPRTDFFVPGSILRIELDTTDPIAKGMPKESIAWAENSPVFEVSGTGVSPVNAGAQGNTGRMPVPQVKIIAWYPKDKDPLLSGWLLGSDRIKGKAALVEVGLGKGRIILFGFRPQYRGQSLATYPLFFNAITSR